MRTKIFFIVMLPIVLQTACLVSLNTAFNNVWKVPGTNLEVAVYKEKTTQTKENTVERKIVLRENHSDRTTFKLQRTGDNFSRVNVYQTTENTFLIRDSFETYELDASAKVLRKITPTDAGVQKYVGAFDYNANGDWRYVPAEERAEIPLGTND